MKCINCIFCNKYKIRHRTAFYCIKTGETMDSYAITKDIECEYNPIYSLDKVADI